MKSHLKYAAAALVAATAIAATTSGTLVLPAQATGSGADRTVLANELAKTPPMGWNAWNTFSTNVTLENVKDTIDFMHDHRVGGKTMAELGYNTVTIDDGWSTTQRKQSNGTLDPAVTWGINGMDLHPDAHLVPNAHFPDHASVVTPSVNVNGIQYLAEYAHSLGMKLGLYSSPTYLTCQGHPGSLDHETTDAADFVSWGVDYVKYDSCPQWQNNNNMTSQNKKAWALGGMVAYPGGSRRSEEQTQSMYARSERFQQALDSAVSTWNSDSAHANKQRSKVVFSISGQPAHNGDGADQASNDPAVGLTYDPATDSSNTSTDWDQGAPGNAPYGRWCGYVANLCRIGGDRSADNDGFTSIYTQMNTSLQFPAFGKSASTGHWNDMDMMFTGWRHAGAGAPFSRDEAISEISILSIMSSPLISGADLRTTAYSGTGIQDADVAVYLNGDVVNVNQDTACTVVKVKDLTDTNGNHVVVLKRLLANGDVAVVFINEGGSTGSNRWGHVTVTPEDIGLTDGTYTFKDLWANTSSTTLTNPNASTGTFSTSSPLGSGNSDYWFSLPHGVKMYRVAHN